MDYDRYRAASEFDNGPHNYAFPVPIADVHCSLARAQARNVALLEQAIESLHDRASEVRCDSEDWIGAAAAIALLGPVMSQRTAELTITARANDGMLRSRAERFVRDSQVLLDVEVPQEFWWARGHSALEQNWTTGDFETWIGPREHWRAYGVRFLRSQIQTMISDAAVDAAQPSPGKHSRDVFIVHGRDGPAKTEVARVIERAGLNAVILHEQANAGRTIIEKFEDHGGSRRSARTGCG